LNASQLDPEGQLRQDIAFLAWFSARKSWNRNALNRQKPPQAGTLLTETNILVAQEVRMEEVLNRSQPDWLTAP